MFKKILKKWKNWSLPTKIGVVGSFASVIALVLYFVPSNSSNNQVALDSSGDCTPNIASNSGNIGVDCSTTISGQFIRDKNKSKTSPLRRIPIRYFTEKVEGSFYSRLKADIKGNQYLIIDESAELCLSVEDERDYDGNGSTDVLVTDITACGGNCCGNSFFFVSYLGNGHFQTSASFGYSWGDPKIESWKGITSVVVTDNNEGFNQNAPEEITVRYVLDSGQALKVEESERKGLVSLKEMKSSDFDYSSYEHRSLFFDLNGDGIDDEIVGTLWHRWGRIMWSLKLSGIGEVNSGSACKRVGVLPTKTNNYNNIVCDHDDVFRWNGKSYMYSISRLD
jgi:hypothetical protein